MKVKPFLNRPASVKLEIFRDWIFSMNNTAIDVTQIATGGATVLQYIGTINSANLGLDVEFDLIDFDADLKFPDMVYIYDAYYGVIEMEIGGNLTNYRILGVMGEGVPIDLDVNQNFVFVIFSQTMVKHSRHESYMQRYPAMGCNWT